MNPSLFKAAGCFWAVFASLFFFWLISGIHHRETANVDPKSAGLSRETVFILVFFAAAFIHMLGRLMAEVALFEAIRLFIQRFFRH